MAASRASSNLAATVGARIRYARQSMGMTQHELAVALGSGDAMKVSRWERGVHLPEGDSLVALAVVLGREPAWFYMQGEPNGVAA